MAPGARNKFGTPMFEPEIFRKQMHCIEETTCDIVGTFWCPHSDSAPDNYLKQFAAASSDVNLFCKFDSCGRFQKLCSK